MSLPGYSQLREVARGGDSVVYRARQDHLDRDVAIKVIDVTDPSSVARFGRELAITVRLGRQHPHIVTVLDTTRTADGRPCLVMDFHDLGSLHDRLRDAGPLTVSETVAAGIAVADALAFAHSHGILHRDVKPQNILLLPTSYVLSDFGIARMADAGHTASLDRFSYRHASPQVLDGLEPTVADDVWSLGSTLFTLVTGRAPFASDDADQDTALAYLRRVRVGQRRPLPPDVPGALRQVIEACLAPEREARPAGAAQVLSALRAVPTEDDAWAPKEAAAISGTGSPAEAVSPLPSHAANAPGTAAPTTGAEPTSPATAGVRDDSPGTDGLGTDSPGTDSPGTDNLGTDAPSADLPGADGPSTDRPGAGRPVEPDEPTTAPPAPEQADDAWGPDGSSAPATPVTDGSPPAREDAAEPVGEKTPPSAASAAHAAPTVAPVLATSALAHLGDDDAPARSAVDADAEATSVRPAAAASRGQKQPTAPAVAAGSKAGSGGRTWIRIAAFIGGALLTGAAVGVLPVIFGGQDTAPPDPDPDPTGAVEVPTYTDPLPEETGPVQPDVGDPALAPRNVHILHRGTSVLITWSPPEQEVESFIVVDPADNMSVVHNLGPEATEAAVDGIDPDAPEVCFAVAGYARQDGELRSGSSAVECAPRPG